jgi:hypothetical protein
VLLGQMAEATHRRFVRHRVVAEIDAHETLQCAPFDQDCQQMRDPSGSGGPILRRILPITAIFDGIMTAFA